MSNKTAIAITCKAFAILRSEKFFLNIRGLISKMKKAMQNSYVFKIYASGL